MNDPAEPDRPVPGGQVAMVVHRESGDTVTRLQAPCHERLRQLARVAGDTSPIGTFDTAVTPARDDLATTTLTLGVVNQVRHPQRPILHATQLPRQHQLSPLKKRAPVWALPVL